MERLREELRQAQKEAQAVRAAEEAHELSLSALQALNRKLQEDNASLELRCKKQNERLEADVVEVRRRERYAFCVPHYHDCSCQGQMAGITSLGKDIQETIEGNSLVSLYPLRAIPSCRVTFLRLTYATTDLDIVWLKTEIILALYEVFVFSRIMYQLRNQLASRAADAEEAQTRAKLDISRLESEIEELRCNPSSAALSR